MIKLYLNFKMLRMLALGFSSGFPLLLLFGTLSLWLKDAGLSLTLIGIFSLVKIPYSFKWLWSPIIDSVKLPLFWRLGRRRGWALFLQLLLMVSIFAMSFCNPDTQPYYLAGFALLTAFVSASQDIVIDAYRIESFSDKEQGAGVSVYVLGYRFGLIVSGAGALLLATFLSWNEVYGVMALCSIVGMVAILVSKEPQGVDDFPKIKNFFKDSVAKPLADFIARPNWWLILLFIMLYKLSDAYMGPMMMPFYDDMGFSKIEIASISKLYGMIATIIGGLLGGYLVLKIGILKSLILCGILQGLSNLIFLIQAHLGHNVDFLILTISIENLSGGMATTAFVAYISALCNKQYTATQYALLTSFMSIARDGFAATSGLLVATTNWTIFFIVTTLMAIPGLLTLYFVEKKVRK